MPELVPSPLVAAEVEKDGDNSVKITVDSDKLASMGDASAPAQVFTSRLQPVESKSRVVVGFSSTLASDYRIGMRFTSTAGLSSCAWLTIEDGRLVVFADAGAQAARRVVLLPPALSAVKRAKLICNVCTGVVVLSVVRPDGTSFTVGNIYGPIGSGSALEVDWMQTLFGGVPGPASAFVVDAVCCVTALSAHTCVKWSQFGAFRSKSAAAGSPFALGPFSIATAIPAANPSPLAIPVPALLHLHFSAVALLGQCASMLIAGVPESELEEFLYPWCALPVVRSASDVTAPHADEVNWVLGNWPAIEQFFQALFPESALLQRRAKFPEAEVCYS